MKRFSWAIGAALLVGMASAAVAELQNVQVGGEVRIRGRYWIGGFGGGQNINHIPLTRARGRALGPFGLTSVYDWDYSGSDRAYLEQKTKLNVKADFTDNVSAFIELDSFAVWGEDFRSQNYITGVDNRATIQGTNAEVEVYQAYIEAKDMFGLPLQARIGRQELVLGKGWLVGNMVSPCLGISFDALRLTYTQDDLFTIDAFAAKLVESLNGDEDVDMYGVYATYTQLDFLDIAGYWVWVRDGRQIDDSPASSLTQEWLEDVFSVNDYDDTQLHTVGVRLNGKYESFDYDAEVAYQFGEAGQAGRGFQSLGIYGDDDAQFDSWATDIEAGYTFDVKFKPRVFLGGAYYQGEDNRDLTFGEWINPFDHQASSVSFNRLFSNIWYSYIFDILGGASTFSNFYQVRGGVTAQPLENLTTGLTLAQFWTDAAFDTPNVWSLGKVQVPISTFLPWDTKNASSDIGFMTRIYAKYNYTENLFITVGWEHLFTGGALLDGSYVLRNGLQNASGSNNNDADYIWFDTGVKF